MTHLVVTGMCVPYGVPSAISRGGRRHLLRRGAFAPRAVELRIDHRPGAIAKQDDGTLKVFDGFSGLHFEARIERSSIASYLRGAFAAGRVRGCSIGLSTIVKDVNVFGLQHVLRGELEEISLIISPAKPAFSSTWAAIAA